MSFNWPLRPNTHLLISLDLEGPIRSINCPRRLGKGLDPADPTRFSAKSAADLRLCHDGVQAREEALTAHETLARVVKETPKYN